MKFTRGQIAVWATIGGSVVVAAISGYFTFLGGNSDALAEENRERKDADTEIKIEIATLKEAVDTTKGDVREIKGDIKELLKRTPK